MPGREGTLRLEVRCVWASTSAETIGELMAKSFSAAWLALLVAACGGSPPLVSSASLTVVDSELGLPAPSRSDFSAPQRLALIGPLDTLDIEVFGVPELSRQVQVDGSGQIAMPLIGAIDVGGRTAPEVAAAIEQDLVARYVRAPEVTVNIRNSVSQFVTVSGEVVEPGLFPVTNQMTLMRAVASARGLSDVASAQDVVILRTVGGQRMAAMYNLSAIRRGVYEDPSIFANDVVVVGDSPTRTALRELAPLATALASPLVAIIR